MDEHLERALLYLDAVGEKVLAHGHGFDGNTYVVILDKGVKGYPKHRIPYDALPELPRPSFDVVTESQEKESPLSFAQLGRVVIKDKPDVADIDYSELGYRELQALAKEAGIPANQSADDLIAALEANDA